jgi:hypothetical protein
MSEWRVGATTSGNERPVCYLPQLQVPGVVRIQSIEAVCKLSFGISRLLARVGHRETKGRLGRLGEGPMPGGVEESGRPQRAIMNCKSRGSSVISSAAAARINSAHVSTASLGNVLQQSAISDGLLQIACPVKSFRPLSRPLFYFGSATMIRLEKGGGGGGSRWGGRDVKLNALQPFRAG